ncbi:MAG: hypothetical protein ABSE07_03210 [Methanoregula sp.]|jgi:hypothetical protein
MKKGLLGGAGKKSSAISPCENTDVLRFDPIPGISGHRMDTHCALVPKKRINAISFDSFLSKFFIEFLTSFFNSGLSGTIFAYLEALWTVQFFKNSQSPYVRPGLKKITGLFRIGDIILWQDSLTFYQE